MKALVTGGAGFIGSHVARCLSDAGADVVIVDDLSGGFRENVPGGARFVEGSITDVALLEQLFAVESFDTVFHLAAYAAEGLSHFIRRFNYTNNVIGSINLINLSVRYEIDCFVFTSSIAVYGCQPPPMAEEMTPQPEDPYGIAKYAVEMDLKAANEQFGLPYVIFRPHNVYGEGQNIGDRYRNVVGIFMNQIMQGRPLTIFGDGEQTRAFSYIADVAPIIAQAPSMPDARRQVFNIGGGTPHSVNALAQAVMTAMGTSVEIQHLAARNEVLHAHASHAKAQRVFATSAATDLATGLERMAAWARDAGCRESSEFENIEIRRGLPAGWS